MGPLLDRSSSCTSAIEAITGLATGYSDLDELLAGLQPSALIVVGARPSMGKALGLDTPIPTPSGWTTMGDLEVGDSVLDDQGQPCTVTYATPVQHDRQCYEVEFDDGSVIIADADHQWFAIAHELGPHLWEPRVVTTTADARRGSDGQRPHELACPCCRGGSTDPTASYLLSRTPSGAGLRRSASSLVSTSEHHSNSGSSSSMACSIPRRA